MLGNVWASLFHLNGIALTAIKQNENLCIGLKVKAANLKLFEGEEMKFNSAMLRMFYKICFLLIFFVSSNSTTSFVMACEPNQTYIDEQYYYSQTACSGGYWDTFCTEEDEEGYCIAEEELWVCPEACYYEVTGVTLSASPSKAAITGNTASFTAQAQGFGPNTYLYEFSTNKILNGQGTTWTTTRNASSAPTWSWSSPSVTGSVYDEYNVAAEAMSFSKYNAYGYFFIEDDSDYDVVDYYVVKRYSPYLSGYLLEIGEENEEYYDYIDVVNGDDIGPYTWQITSGSLPNGITFDTTTGEFNGTPTQSGTYTFTVKVTDGFNLYTETKQFTLKVAPPLSITISRDSGTLNTQYMETSTTSGGMSPYKWSVYSGTLPPGLTLDPISGSISGTPTA
jgi:hypothetical protein